MPRNVQRGVDMRNALFQAICRTGIFMICAQAIVHFRPQESYEKYLKLLVSVMVLIQLFLPLGSFFAGIRGEAAAGQLEDFRQSLEQSMEEARQKAEETDALLERMTLDEVRRRMEAQAAEGAEAQTSQQPGQQDELTLEPQAGQQTEDVPIELQNIDVQIEAIEPILGH